MKATSRSERETFGVVINAIMAAVLADCTSDLRDREITVTGREAHSTAGTLAGSVVTTAGALRNLVPLDVAREDADAAATRAPGRLIRREDLGDLAPRGSGDDVVLNNSHEVVRTVAKGSEVSAA